MGGGPTSDLRFTPVSGGDSIVFANPSGVDGMGKDDPKGWYWSNYAYGTRETEFAEFDYPGFDFISTIRLGRRKQENTASVLGVDTWDEVLKEGQLRNGILCSKICTVVMPDTYTSLRVRVIGFQQTAKPLLWTGNLHVCQFDLKWTTLGDSI